MSPPDPQSTVPPRRDRGGSPPGGAAAPGRRPDLVVAGAADVVAAAALPVPGERVGPCVVERLLARGGMGAVYVARDAANRQVALKVMLEGGATAAARFEREGRAVARLAHPGVVRVHDLGQSGGRAYLVMDLVPGESLHARLEREGPLPFDEAARLTLEVARALAHAHERGVLHRDVKPHNVLLTPDSRPVVTDFGLARVEDQTQALTRSGAALGTPAYMPPEQARGAVAKMGPASDIYGLGATLFAMLTGEPPFSGDGLLEVVVQVLGVEARPPSALRPGVPPGLDAICLTCLQKEPVDRYAGADDLARDLERWLAGDDVDPLRPARRRRRRRRLAWSAAGLAAAAMLASGVAAAAALTRVPAAPVVEGQAPASPQEVSPALGLAGEGARDLVLPASGSLALPLEVRPGEVALVLRLRPAARGAWGLAVDAPTGLELARTPEGATPGEDETERTLALTADAALPLRAGAHTLRVVGPPGGRARLTLRAHASIREALGEPFDLTSPLPPLEECFAPAARDTAAQLLSTLAAFAGEEVEWVDEGQDEVALESVAAHALESLEGLAAREGTPRAGLLTALLRVRTSGSTDVAWRTSARRLRAAAGRAPKAPEVHQALGRLLLAERRHDEARPLLARAVALAPRALPSRLHLARCELARGALPAAEACARAVLARDPGQPGASAILGQVELARDPPRWEQAVPHLLFAVERSGGVTSVNLVHRLMLRVRAVGAGDPAARSAAGRVVELLAPTPPEALAARFKATRLGAVRLEVARGLALAHAGDVAAGLAGLRALRDTLEPTGYAGVNAQRRALREAIAEVEALARTPAGGAPR